MKLLVYRVARASIEVSGVVESSIGSGLVLMLGLRTGDVAADAVKLAQQALSLNLWPELMDPDIPWRTNVVENGLEVAAVLEPSLCIKIARNVPVSQDVMSSIEARVIFQAFVQSLQKGYQEEMVVSAPLDRKCHLDLKIQGGVFELSTEVAQTAPAPAPEVRKQPTAVQDLDLLAVTDILRQIPGLPKNRATLETCRVFRAFGAKKFRTALSEAAQAEAEAFASALEGAAGFFTKTQQEQIIAWTGLSISAAPLHKEEEAASGTDEPLDEGSAEDHQLLEQLAELREEVENPQAVAARKRKLDQVKVESQQDRPRNRFAPLEEVKFGRIQPDLRGRPAPDTPSAANAARQWAASRQQPKGFGKGFGKAKGTWRPPRSCGIVSLDESARIHGGFSQAFQFGQHARYPGPLLNVKAETQVGRTSHIAPLTLKKGTPTVAPMTPAPDGVMEDI